MPYIKMTADGYEIKPLVSNRVLLVLAIFVSEFCTFQWVVKRICLNF